MNKRDDIKAIKDYCIKYLNTYYGINNNYIKATRITKNGLFLYGHEVYAPGYSLTYKIETYISWYESNNYNYINELLEQFVLDSKRLKEDLEDE